jgi:hypothetical protein
MAIRPAEQRPSGHTAASATAPTSRAPTVLHGSWLPDEDGGRFALWGERSEEIRRPRKSEHPFQLRWSDLVNAVSESLPSSQDAGILSDSPSRIWATLPGDGIQPSPSLELQADLDGEVPEPTSWRTWRVDAVFAPDPLTLLTSSDLRNSESVRSTRIGHDLRFWSRLAVALEWVVRRHEYLPAIFPHEAGKPRARRSRGKAPAFKFDAGWELADAAEEAIVKAFARSMPGACRALRAGTPADNGGAFTLHEPQALVRHFLAVQLQRLVLRTRFPQSALYQVEGSFIARALPEARARYRRSEPLPIGEPDWAQWRRWRDRIQRSSFGADERVCFRLADPHRDSPDTWRLEWLLSSRGDPSLLVPLADFWGSAEEAGRRSPRSVREVLLQLGQASRIYGRLWEGMNTGAPSGVNLDRDSALEFLKTHAPVLQSAGFRVIVPAWWTATGQRRLRLRLAPRAFGSSESAGTESSGILGFDTLVEFQAQVVLDGQPLTRREWEQLVASKEGLVRVRGQWMELRSEEVARLEEYWRAGDGLRNMTVADLVREQAGSDSLEIDPASDFGQMLAALEGTGALKMLDQPSGFVGELRGYQVRGYSWLAYLERLGFGACLADDMGLGKTIQVLATILGEKTRNPNSGPTLLIAPTSVLGNWSRETRRFAPALSAYILHGPERPRTKATLTEAISGKDIVIASFGVARLDAARLKEISWHRLVVDESQNIKNPTAAVTKAVRSFQAPRRVALTGTPVENRLMDLWSLFSVLNPGFLGNATAFRKEFERPIMLHQDTTATQRLRGMVRPFILRRMKTDKSIIQDLPDKVEQNSSCNLTPEQAALYEAVVTDLEGKLSDAEGIGRQGLMLSTLLRLKQICNHPAQFLQDASEFSESRSHKLARVCEMLDEIEAEGESALVFTQFTEIGKELDALFRRRYSGAVYYLHGGTPRARREHMVEEFQDPDSERAIFVLSLRAGGTGITLTRANHVIHFDRWWNPAVENQATDRAFRIGQEKTVFVHKMVTMGTLEERIDEMIESKKKLAEEIVGNDESWLAKLDNEAFRNLIALDRSEAVVG